MLVTTHQTSPPATASACREWMTANAGVTLGIPLGRGSRAPMRKKEDFLRIGHMGHVNAHYGAGA